MRCRVLVLVFLLLLVGRAQARPIRIEKSFPQGVLYLLECLREEPHHSAHLRQVFLSGHPLTRQEEEALSGYRAMIEREHGRPGRAQPGLDLVLERLAADSGTMEAFLAEARRRLAPPDAEALARATRAFQGPYRALVWEPCQEDLDRQIAELRAGFEAVDAAERLDEVANLLRSTWPEDRPLRVLLTPIPKKPGQPIVAHGHSNGSLQIAEAPTGAPRKHAAPVLFHEMCHALWRERSRPAEVDAWFHPAPLARQQLDEALATALGNGWFASLVEGRLPEGSWYENEGIDGYAKALYPVLQQALDRRQPLDEALARRAIAAFEEAFPGAWREPSLVTARLFLVAEEREDLTLERIVDLGKSVQLRDCSAASPVGAARAGFDGMAGGMVVFLLPPGALGSLDPYPLAAEDRRALRERAAPYLWARWAGDRWIVVSVAAGPEERRAALVRFLRQDLLSEGFQP